jgi:hypothetical protein
MKGAITPWTENLYKLFFTALGDDEAEVQSNAAFASGMLVEHSETDMSSQYVSLLGALRPVFMVTLNAPHARLNARDNAAGAVARLIVRNTAAVPLDVVLPAFVDALPLKADPLENRPVFRALFHLFRVQPQILTPYLDKLLVVFAYVLDPSQDEQIPDETRAELLQLVRALNMEAPAQVQAAGLSAYL